MKKMISVILCVCLLFSVFAGCQSRDDSIPNVDAESILVVPSSETDGMIPTDARLYLSFNQKKLSAGDVRRVFQFDPPVEFEVEKNKNGMAIVPNAPFQENSIVNLQALDSRGHVIKSWAFQTQVGFSVLGTMPADGGDYVPVTTGIEVQLSHPNVSPENFEKCFTLVAADSGETIEGKASRYADTLVYVPDRPLEFMSAYTATISGDLATSDGTVLGKPVSFSFETAASDKGAAMDYFENASPVTETFIRGEAPLIAVNCDRAYRDVPLSVSIYRFRSAEDYVAALAAFADKRGVSRVESTVASCVDLTKMDSLGTFQSKLSVPSVEGYYGMNYISLPGDYEKGWYYIQVSVTNPESGREKNLYKLIQISDLSVYYAQADESSLFWLNNAQTGQPVSGASINITGAVTASGETEREGTALISAALPVPEPDQLKAEECVLTIRSGDDIFIDLYRAQPDREPSANERYISYLYTDRPIYMSTDKIYAWGLVRPREGGQNPDQLRLAFGDYEEDYITVPIELAPDGTFTAELPFEKMGGKEARTWRLRLKCGEDEELLSSYIEVADYVKPAYVPAITFDKPVYQANETVKATFSASFFDGTPADGFSAEFSFLDSSVLTTDENGRAVKETLIPDIEGPSTWQPQNINYSAANAGGENVNFYLSGNCMVLYRDVAVRGEVDQDGNRLTILTNQIDTSRIREPSDLYDWNRLIGEPVDSDVVAELRRVYYTKTANGSYYDFIEKRNVTNYRYDRHEDIVSTKTYRTQDGRYILEELPVSDAESTYYVELHAVDSKGRISTERVWLGSELYYYDSGIHNYSFLKRSAKEDYRSLFTFKENEKTVFHVQDNGRLVGEGKVLYAIAKEGFLDFGVEEQPQVTVPFDEKLVPNYVVMGAYFDGRHIYDISFSSILFDPQSRRLSLEITADQEKYSPGGSAKVDVFAAYEKDGTPAANTAVSLSLVDEAVFAIQEQDVQPLEELYRYAFDPKVHSFASYIQYNFAGYSGGEKGGGGGDGGIRRDFEDTAAFLHGTTGNDGHIEFEIALPDNITSWRATVQAVSQDLFAGNARQPIVVTKDFFLNEVLSSQYLTGDDVMVTLRSYGGEVGANEEIRYTVEVEGNGQTTRNTVSGMHNQPVAASLGKLQKGTYEVTMTAEGEKGQDKVQKTIQVVDSGVECWIAGTYDLNQDKIQVEPEKFPVTVGLYNKDYKMYADVLHHLMRYAAGSARADARIARMFAQKRIAQMSDAESAWPIGQEEDDLGDVITPTGFVSLFSYDSARLPLAARVHLAIPEELPGAHPVEVFYHAIGNEYTVQNSADQDSIATAYLGLAAHKEPVLSKVRDMLLHTRPLSEKSRLTLTAALAALGDVDGARLYYEELVSPKLAEGTNAGGERTLWMNMGEDINENIEYTALASLIASMTRNDDANGMMRYLMSNRSTMDLYLLEEIVYLRYMEPQGGEEARVSYKRGGKTETLKLDKSGMRFLRFTSADFEQADIRVKNGNVFAQVSYTGSITEAVKTDDQTIQMSRSMEVVRGDGMRPGSIVKITLRPVLPKDTMNPAGTVINDYIPSGMRYLNMGDLESNAKSSYGLPWRLVTREGQRVSFYYSAMEREIQYDEEGNVIEEPEPGEQKYEPLQALTYYVRCAAPGEYVVDSAYVRADTSPDWGISEKIQVRILE